MKKWTIRFLGRKVGKKDRPSQINAKRAHESPLKVPQELWKEISLEIPESELFGSIRENDSPDIYKFNTVFMAGFAVGWAEKSRNIV